MTKIRLPPLLTRPQGCQGCQKSRRPNWSPLWWVGALRFSQNWRNCEKPSKLNKNCQRNPFFQILFNLDWILTLQLTYVVFSLVFRIFWHPWHPWGHVNSGDIIVLRFVFDIFAPQRHLPIFFILFKLMPDITCIDLTSIKGDNITFLSHNGWIYKVVQAVSVVLHNINKSELDRSMCNWSCRSLERLFSRKLKLSFLGWFPHFEGL